MPADRPRVRPPWSSLARELTVILAFKAIALCLLWLVFFSSPAGRRLDAGAVTRSLLAPPAQDARPQRTDHAARPASR